MQDLFPQIFAIRYELMPLRWTVHEPSVPPQLQRDVHHVRLFDNRSPKPYCVKVAPVALPGIVLHHRGRSGAIRNIETPLGLTSRLPLIFVYGAGTTPSTMRFHGGPHTTIQIILKPHGLRSLLGLNAASLRNNFLPLSQLPRAPLQRDVLALSPSEAKLSALLQYLEAESTLHNTHDPLVVLALEWMDEQICDLRLPRLLKDLGVTERQLQRRFLASVGVTPKTYIRIRRFNEALRMMKGRRHATLASIAYELNFADQSHFIRDLKAFSLVTPRGLSERADHFHELAGFSYAD